MNYDETEQLIVSYISALYDPEEAHAIASGYMQDKLNFVPGITGKMNAVPELTDHFYADMDLLASGKPLQYVTGIQHFYGMIFKVNESVLIPRPETEELVEWAEKFIKKNNKRITLLDIGTGSGCIAITLKIKNPDASVYAMDVSPPALSLAKENAGDYNVIIHFFQDNILLPVVKIAEKFNIIISNPPYIPLSEGDSLSDHVLNYEPHLALFAPEEDPIIYYKAIANYALENLEEGGTLFFEMHPDFAEHVAGYLNNAGFTDVMVRNDLSGKARFLKATRLISND